MLKFNIDTIHIMVIDCKADAIASLNDYPDIVRLIATKDSIYIRPFGEDTDDYNI